MCALFQHKIWVMKLVELGGELESCLHRHSFRNLFGINDHN